MLRGMRKASSNWLGRAVMGVVLGLIAVSFAIWGIGDIFRGFGRSTVAKVGSTEITIDQFRQIYNERLQQLGRQLGRQLTMDQARAIGIDRQVGPVAPEMDAGRYPENTDEIALGGRTMRDLHTHIGAHITATIQDKVVDLEVVGRTTLPSFGNARFGGTGLGTGALGTAARFPIHDDNEPDGRFNYMLIRFKAGTTADSETQITMSARR